MKIYFAPMEGITGYIYRNAFHACFGGADKYFTPFLSPNQNRALSPKEIRDVLPENNKGMYVVPQILTNRAEYFIRAAKELKEEYGYEEVNLNLGCPSGTVAAKGKGAGFLAKPEELSRFLFEIFEQAEVKISIKTRIGMEEPEEFDTLLAIYQQYPLHELIIHPRLQKDYYKNKPNREIFAKAVAESSCSLCYNGDIFERKDYQDFCMEFPQVDKIMLGRGLLMNPGFIAQIKGNEVRVEEIKQFHDRLYASYQEVLFGETTVLFKMKELWFYLLQSFPDSRKYEKKIKKAARLGEYEEIVRRLFQEEMEGNRQHA